MIVRFFFDVFILGVICIVIEVKEGGDNKVGFDMFWTCCVSGVCFVIVKFDVVSFVKICVVKVGCIVFMDVVGCNIVVFFFGIEID